MRDRGRGEKGRVRENGEVGRGERERERNAERDNIVIDVGVIRTLSH